MIEMPLFDAIWNAISLSIGSWMFLVIILGIFSFVFVGILFQIGFIDNIIISSIPFSVYSMVGMTFGWLQGALILIYGIKLYLIISGLVEQKYTG